MCPGHFYFMLDGKVGVPSLKNDTVTKYIPLYVLSHLFQPHIVNNGLTDIEDVGILVQNNQKTINGLYGGRESLNY